MVKGDQQKELQSERQSFSMFKNFADGHPTQENPIPTVNMGYNNVSTPKPRRTIVRKPLVPSVSNGEERQDEPNEVLFASKLTNSYQEPCSELKAETEQCMAVCCQRYPHLCKNSTVRPELVDSSTQTEDLVKLDHPYAYQRTSRNVSTQHTTPEFSIENTISNTDARFYTGLTYTVLMTLITTLSSFGKKLSYKLNVADQILSVLMRLRLGLNFHDIGRRFNISRQLASCIFNSWIEIMAVELSDCIV